MLTKIIKNTTQSEKEWVDKIVAAGESYTIQRHEDSKWAADAEVISDVQSGDAVINDGTQDLSASDGEQWLKFLDDATKITLDSTVFNSKEMKSGIEETPVKVSYDAGAGADTLTAKVKELIIEGNATVEENEDDTVTVRIGGQGGKLGGTFQATFLENGTPRDEWLKQFGENIPSNQSPYVVPFNAKLIGITYSNKNSGVDAYIEVWASALGDGLTKTRVFNWHVNNKRLGYKTNFDPDITFDAGDKISIYNEDVGTNANDAVVVLYFQIINTTTNEEWENFGGSQGGGGTSS
jgi:hypothetical protein